MATLSYWEKRMEQLYSAQDKQNNKLDKRLRKEYIRIEESIKNDIASYYQKYGKDNVLEYRQMLLSLSQAERDLLYKDYQSFSMRYPKYAHLMPVRESIYKLNRLEGLQLSTRMKMLELGAFEQQGFEKLLKDAYERGYLSAMKGLDNAPSFFSVNDIALQQTLNDKWINGGNFSDRIWSNKDKLINTLNNEIRDAIIRGDDYQQMKRLLKNRIEVGSFESHRLVATESAFVMNQANKQAFMDAGIERYEITAVLDKRTSPTCKHMDGEIFDFKEAKSGVNYPPFHPWCRTTTIPIENNVNSDKIKIEEARRYIKSTNQRKNVNSGKQNKHILGTNEYKQKQQELKRENQYGPSYLTINYDEIQELVIKYAGTGEIKLNKKGDWDNKEVILKNDLIIGLVVDNRNGNSAETSVFKIHYSEDGTHLVPDYPSKKKGGKQK